MIYQEHLPTLLLLPAYKVYDKGMTPHPPPQASETETATFKDSVAATLKAMGQSPFIGISFAAAETIDTPSPLGINNARLPEPPKTMSADTRTLVRGAADAKALRLLYTNTQTHARLKPNHLHGGLIFDALEQARAEALGMQDMRGVYTNLHAVLCERARIKHTNGFDTVSASKADEALYLMARCAMTGEDIPPASEKLIETWTPYIETQLGPHGLDRLKNVMADQKAFGETVKSILVHLQLIPEEVDASADTAGNNPDQSKNDDQDDTEEGQNKKPEQTLKDESSSSPPDSDDATPESDSFIKTIEVMDTPETDDTLKPHETVDDDDDNTPPSPSAARAEQLSGVTHHVPYHVYTSEFDEIIDAKDLADTAEQERLRRQLDKQVEPIASTISRMASRLQRYLQARQERAWDFDQEEGVLDQTRLARMIANPTITLTYKRERETAFRDTVVCLLIDNSGSMRGRPIATAAVTADLISRTLERCGVKCEILGFTTRAWKGGKSREKWVQNGCPDDPGRLNDIRHVIYKSAETPYRRARPVLGVMLKEGLLKENIDGEALVWAHNRLTQRPEDRKILIVISDGAPVDDSTLSVNPANILEQDLTNVVHWIEHHSAIELSAIGIGHDVSRTYTRAMKIDSVDTLAAALTHELVALFAAEEG